MQTQFSFACKASLLSVLFLFFFYNLLNAQPELDIPIYDRVLETPCRGYTQLGSTVGIWDWRIPNYYINFYPGNSSTSSERIVQSPFEGFFTNTAHLAIHPGEGNDYEPADGWELLYHNLGTQNFPVEEPSFALYNRYDGRIRIFFYLEPNNGDAADNVLITFKHSLAAGALDEVNAIFENLNIPANALADFDLTRGQDGVTQLNSGEANSTWYLLETVASYDPCVCQASSAFVTRPILSDASELLFEIEGTGYSEALYSPGSSSGSYVGTALEYANGLFGTAQSGYKTYKDLNEYMDIVDTITSNNTLAEVLASKIPSWFPSAGLSAKLLGFVIGKAFSAGSPKLTGYNHNFNFTGNGTLVDDDSYNPYFFYAPGAFYDPRNPSAHRPIYDNPLGVFTVLESPVIERATKTVTEVKNGTEITTEIASYRYTGDLKYHINVLAGISNQPVRLMGSLVLASCNSPFIISSPVLNLTCLEDYPLEVDELTVYEIDFGNGSTWTETDERCYTPELQIVAILESNSPGAGEEIVFSARYKGEIDQLGNITFPQNPYSGLTPDQIFALCDPPVDQPVADQELIRFCKNTYNPNIGRSAWWTEEEQNNNGEKFSWNVFPNPFQENLNLEIPAEWTQQPLVIGLYDILGRKIWQEDFEFSTPGIHPLSANLSNLLPGSYVLEINGSTFSSSLPVQKQ